MSKHRPPTESAIDHPYVLFMRDAAGPKLSSELYLGRLTDNALAPTPRLGCALRFQTATEGYLFATENGALDDWHVGKR